MAVLREEIIHEIAKITGEENVVLNAPMKEYTSFRVGGPALLLSTPRRADEFTKIIKLLSDFPYYVIGNGTNLLVADSGYDGVIIRTSGLSGITINGCEIEAGAGEALSGVSRAACQHGLSGLEFAEGIPGTVGGGAAMNAGAYGGELKDVITSLTVSDRQGNISVLENQQLNFGYRHSILLENGLFCLSALIRLKKGEKNAIKEKMDRNRQQRTEKQPLALPSAGSTFKRPPGHFAGKLISDAGLRGYKIGGASVSEKHCGFVVNSGNASASDIAKLIKHIQEAVFEQFGVKLETEVKIIGGI